MNTHSSVKLPFRGFDERAPVRIYDNGLLPHWRQDGCTYFVTFRLADSLPRRQLDILRERRNAELRAAGVSSWEEARRSLPESVWRRLEQELHRNLEKHLDTGLGQCLLRQLECMEIVAGALEYFHGKRVHTGDFVIMPNHVHALLQPMPGYELETILHSIKSYTGNAIHRRLQRSGTLWQEESYDRIVRDSDALDSFQSYIRENPQKAKLPEGCYRLSTATY